ncbi:AAA family ATPase [Vibrio azureus]|uniref:ORC1/DEAH AAA+ ATPase domain-containing protein n=1 Tax=Vibrio azureus NBRC 104587 TaxID=1219077 RepID=U3C855_9VIBR|nr:AAA family ATPase [Vibrio azureus]GAD74633.1 hypothetical protein VAZ01S_013_00400 [Vibrio azureus NBRC 104587]
MPFATHALFWVLLMFIPPTQAMEDYEFQYKPQPLPIAQDIAQKVTDLPELAFISPQDQQTVNHLLRIVIEQLQKQTEAFSKQLSHYHNVNNEQDWQTIQLRYLTINSLSRSKEKLLTFATAQTRERLTGFGPLGVTQFKQEWYQTRLNFEYLILFQIRSFKLLGQQMVISPIPVIWSSVKVLFIFAILFWWLSNSKRMTDLFRQRHLNEVISPPVWVRLVWYICRANKAIAWLIALILSIRVLSQLPSLQHLSIFEIFTWWILGGAIIINIILEFTARNVRGAGPKTLKLCLITIRRYIWSIIIAGVILQISMQTLGKGTIYSWISSVVFVWFVLITLAVLRLWRETVFQAADKVVEQPALVSWAQAHKKRFFISLFCTAITAVWLLFTQLKYRLITLLSKYTLFSQALAYLFRIEVSKQTNTKGNDATLVRIRGERTFDYIQPGHPNSTLVSYAADEIKQISKYVLTDGPAVCVVTGERGIGTTTFLHTLLGKVKNAEPIYLNCTHGGYNDFITDLAAALGLAENVTEQQILSFLRESDTVYLIAVDNAQRLVKPTVGGLESLIKLTNLLRRSKLNHRVIIAIEKSSWRFVDRARGERLLFDWISVMPKWNEKQLADLFDSRINQEQTHQLSFVGLVVPKQWAQEDITEEERAKQGFYRILWHYSDGNPTVALRFFRLSLRQDKETQEVVVRLFHAPESQELEKMPKPMLAVLRSIVQLEVASPEELSECTQLSVAEVIGTLRYFQSRGFIEWNKDKARVSDHWFRHITNVLDRQHLLVK